MMTALDTNVLVRYLTQDDAAQFRTVMQMLERPRAMFFVCDLVLIEADWVLRSLYDWSGAEVADAFARLTTIHNLVFENETRLRSSLKALRDGADLADELIVRSCQDRESKAFVTFDREIIRRHKPFAKTPS
jgi:predicted nucleic-acid-binding protein